MPFMNEAKASDARSSFAAIQRQAMEEGQPENSPEDEGIEVGDQLMIMPRLSLEPVASPMLQRQGPVGGSPFSAGVCPRNMRSVTSGKFEGGKTLDDYYPDLVGSGSWGKNDTAGPFDTGTRAGSSVQLIGEYAAPCDPNITYTLGQMATIVRARADGKKMMENGKPLEGQTLDDIKRSMRDQSKPPFRQEFGFAVTMADPISGIPYSTLKSYELEVNLTSSVSGPDGTRSVTWGVTIEAANGKVTKNVVR